MTLISGKIRLAVLILLLFLIAATSVFGLYNSSAILENHGTISYLLSARSYQSELRGVLVKYISNFVHDDDLICQTLASYGINAVYLEVNPFAWTGYNLKDFQSMINACKKYGLEFHVLIKYAGYDSSYTDGSESGYPYGLKGTNPDWRAVDVNGNYVGWACLQRASTRDRIKQVVETMAIAFPDIVDINHDYIRYPTTDVINVPDISFRVCYCNECKAAFDAWLEASQKAPIANWPTDCAYPNGSRWKDFAEWRVNPINNIVRDVRQWALAKKPNLIFTADVWRPYIGWTPDEYKYVMGQDPAYWISQGWLDSINPMIYVGNNVSLSDSINKVIQYQTGNNKGAIPLVPFLTQGGPGADVGTAVSVDFWVQEIDYLRQNGCNGFIIWRYSGPGFSEPGTPFTDIRPYLAAIRDRCAKGAYTVFKQMRPIVVGSTITWNTSLPTTGKVEYSQAPMFTATSKNGSDLPYLDIDYVPGTLLSESMSSTAHSIVVPLPLPFYFRIRDSDSNVEIASPVYLNAD